MFLSHLVSVGNECTRLSSRTQEHSLFNHLPRATLSFSYVGCGFASLLLDFREFPYLIRLSNLTSYLACLSHPPQEFTKTKPINKQKLKRPNFLHLGFKPCILKGFPKLKWADLGWRGGHSLSTVLTTQGGRLEFKAIHLKNENNQRKKERKKESKKERMKERKEEGKKERKGRRHIIKAHQHSSVETVDWGSLDLESSGCFKFGSEGYLSRKMEDLVPERDLNQAELSKRFQWGRTSVWGLRTVFL